MPDYARLRVIDNDELTRHALRKRIVSSRQIVFLFPFFFFFLSPENRHVVFLVPLSNLIRFLCRSTYRHFGRTSVSDNPANSKSISGNIDRGSDERRPNKSADDGIRQVNWLGPLSTKARRRDTRRREEKQFSGVIVCARVRVRASHRRRISPAGGGNCKGEETL